MAEHYRNEAEVFLSDLGRQKNSFPVFEKMELRFSMNSTFRDTGSLVTSQWAVETVIRSLPDCSCVSGSELLRSPHRTTSVA